jgi:hypothetical protein
MKRILPPNPKFNLDTVSSSEILEYSMFEIRNTGGDEIAGAGNTYDVKGSVEEEIYWQKSSMDETKQSIWQVLFPVQCCRPLAYPYRPHCHQVGFRYSHGLRSVADQLLAHGNYRTASCLFHHPENSLVPPRTINLNSQKSTSTASKVRAQKNRNRNGHLHYRAARSSVFVIWCARNRIKLAEVSVLHPSAFLSLSQSSLCYTCCIIGIAQLGLDTLLWSSFSWCS